MPIFTVQVHEVYIQEVEIEAKDEHEALLKVEQGEGEKINDSGTGPLFSHVLDKEEWWVESENGEVKIGKEILQT